MTVTKANWLQKADRDDCLCAAEFLCLLADDADAKAMVKAFKNAKTQKKKTRDILRASGLPLLSGDDANVRVHMTQLRDGDTLSPVLLVRGDLRVGAPLTIADGYHRVCAAHLMDDDAEVCCKVVSLVD
jgi:hypothetical protein